MQNRQTIDQLQNLVFGEDNDDFIAQIKYQKTNKTDTNENIVQEEKVQNSFFDSDEETSKSWADVDNQMVGEIMDPKITSQNVKLQQLPAINKSDISTNRIYKFVSCGSDIIVLIDMNNYLKVFYADGSFKSFFLTQIENPMTKQSQNPNDVNKILDLCYIQSRNEVLVLCPYTLISLSLSDLKIELVHVNYHYSARKQRWQCCMDLKDGAFALFTQDGELCFVNSVTKQIFQTQRLQLRPRAAVFKGDTSTFNDSLIAVSDGRLGIQILQIFKDPLDGTYDVEQCFFNAQAHVVSLSINQQYLALGHINGYVSLIQLQGIIQNSGNTQTIVLRTATTPITCNNLSNRFLYYCDRKKGRIVDLKDFSILLTEGVLKGAQVKVIEANREAQNTETSLLCAGSSGELRAFKLDFE